MVLSSLYAPLCVIYYVRTECRALSNVSISFAFWLCTGALAVGDRG